MKKHQTERLPVSYGQCNVCCFVLSQENSSWRLCCLESLRAFVSHCTEELIWLNEREEEELAFDWSDSNTNMAAKREQYTVRHPSIERCSSSILPPDTTCSFTDLDMFFAFWHTNEFNGLSKNNIFRAIPGSMHWLLIGFWNGFDESFTVRSIKCIYKLD